MVKKQGRHMIKKESEESCHTQRIDVSGIRKWKGEERIWKVDWEGTVMHENEIKWTMNYGGLIKEL